jgi:iron complex outermembrane recepter protein
VALWNNQVKHRIVSSYDEDQRISTHVNVPGINFAGVDFDANYQITDDLLVYGSATYTGARVTSDIPMGATTTTVGGVTTTTYKFAFTEGRQLADSAKWMFAGRVQYKVLPELKLGMDAKYVSSRYASDDDNIRVPDYYIAGADVTYYLDKLGMEGSALRFNVDNMFNKDYYGRINTTRLCYSTVTGCTSKAAVKVGSPQTFSLTLTVKY